MPASITMEEPHRSRFVELLNRGAARQDIHAPSGARALGAPSPAFIDRELDRVRTHGNHICAHIDESRFRPNGRILDAGCGTAALAVALAIRFPDADVRAFDADPATLEAASVRVAAHGLTRPIDLACVAPGAPLPYPRESFGLVTCASVIEFIPDAEDRRRFLGALADATSPGGLMLLTTPNPLYPMELHTRLAFQNWRRSPAAPWASTRRWIARSLPGFDHVPDLSKTPQRLRRRFGPLPGLSLFAAIDQLRPWQFLAFRKRER